MEYNTIIRLNEGCFKDFVGKLEDDFLLRDSTIEMVFWLSNRASFIRVIVTVTLFLTKNYKDKNLPP